MPRRISWLSLSLAILVCLATHSPALAAGLPAGFVSAYRSALLAMQKTYADATVEGTVRQESASTGKTLDQRFTLRSTGTWVRLDATIVNPPGARNRDGKTLVVLATPDASLHTYQSPGDPMFDFDSIKEDQYGPAKARIGSLVPLHLAYSFNNQGTIIDSLSRSDVKITGFKTTHKDGERLVTIHYEQMTDHEGRPGPWNCSLLIAPDEGFALRSYSRTTGSGSRQVTFRGSLKYSVDRHGVPLVESIDRRQFQGNAQVERNVVSVSKFDTEPPRKSYFRADSM
jgi:hypothetical protein